VRRPGGRFAARCTIWYARTYHVNLGRRVGWDAAATAEAEQAVLGFLAHNLR
jgi:hypothetical protein